MIWIALKTIKNMIKQDWFNLRQKIIDVKNKKIRLSILQNSQESRDFKLASNCNGFGRLRHFKEYKSKSWCIDPLPMYPAAKALNCEIEQARLAQVFQVAGCNYRCWYCFVDFELLNANKELSHFVSIEEMIDLYLNQENRPLVLDLSGGNPGLVPEWILWTLKEVEKRNQRVYVWADDNLSVDFISKKLSSSEMDFITKSKNFGSVACFKGFDEESFLFNTCVKNQKFEDQLEVFQTYYSYGWDIYGYVTFTTPTNNNVKSRINKFIDSLQKIDFILPLKIVPLEIKVYSPTKTRINPIREKSIEYQYEVLEEWTATLQERFDHSILHTPICDLKYNLK